MTPALLVLAPHRVNKPVGDFRPSLFLAGTIDNGQSVDWQHGVYEALKDLMSVVYNPRRDDWDASWEQTADFMPFHEQVTWELDMLEQADIVLFHFEPGSQSPVSLLELGLRAASRPEATYVSCPPEFWRKGNVDIVCERHGVAVFPHCDDMVAHLRGMLGEQAGA